MITIERAGLALAALASYREPTRRSLLHRSTVKAPFPPCMVAKEHDVLTEFCTTRALDEGKHLWRLSRWAARPRRGLATGLGRVHRVRDAAAHRMHCASHHLASVLMQSLHAPFCLLQSRNPSRRGRRTPLSCRAPYLRAGEHGADKKIELIAYTSECAGAGQTRVAWQH